MIVLVLYVIGKILGADLPTDLLSLCAVEMFLMDWWLIPFLAMILKDKN